MGFLFSLFGKLVASATSNGTSPLPSILGLPPAAAQYGHPFDRTRIKRAGGLDRRKRPHNEGRNRTQENARRVRQGVS